MGICLGVPYLEYEDIRQGANVFLGRYYPAKSIPLPIERIVEQNLQLDIVPIPNLLKDHRVDGFIKSNGREIVIDEFICDRRPARYRFTLAHEVGHLQMHLGLFTKVGIGRVQDWIAFWNDLSEKSRRYLEWQANAFAGLVLVPGEHLESEIRSWVGKFSREIIIARNAKISEESIEDQLRKAISDQICLRFEVSPEVINRRIDKEGFILSAML